MKKIKSKLTLNKTTVSSLNNQQMGQIKGGTDTIEIDFAPPTTACSGLPEYNPTSTNPTCGYCTALGYCTTTARSVGNPTTCS